MKKCRWFAIMDEDGDILTDGGRVRRPMVFTDPAAAAAKRLYDGERVVEVKITDKTAVKK